MLEKLKLFGNKTPNITSLYDMNGVKKTLNIFGKAKLGNLAKQTGEPMNRGDARSDLVGGFEKKEGQWQTCLQITESRRTLWPKKWRIIASWSMSLEKDVRN